MYTDNWDESRNRPYFLYGFKCNLVSWNYDEIIAEKNWESHMVTDVSDPFAFYERITKLEINDMLEAGIYCPPEKRSLSNREEYEAEIAYTNMKSKILYLIMQLFNYLSIFGLISIAINGAWNFFFKKNLIFNSIEFSLYWKLMLVFFLFVFFVILTVISNITTKLNLRNRILNIEYQTTLWDDADAKIKKAKCVLDLEPNSLQKERSKALFEELLEEK